MPSSPQNHSIRCVPVLSPSASLCAASLWNRMHLSKGRATPQIPFHPHRGSLRLLDQTLYPFPPCPQEDPSPPVGDSPWTTTRECSTRSDLQFADFLDLLRPPPCPPRAGTEAPPLRIEKTIPGLSPAPTAPCAPARRWPPGGNKPHPHRHPLPV